MKSQWFSCLSRSALFCWMLGFAAVGHAAESFAELQPGRIAEIEAMLPERPAGFGKPCGDRGFWNSPATRALAGTAAAEAEKLRGQKFPAWSDDLYLDYSRTGNRPPGEQMVRRREAWLCPLVVAECLEDHGRFLPVIQKILSEYAREPSWTLPAHDGNLDNFKRGKFSVDLRSSAFGAELAQALYLLGDRLDPAVRRQVAAALGQRVFAPIRHTLLTGDGTYWLGSKSSPVQNNWNAVCLAGVVGAARTLLPDRHERAVFIAAGEHYSAYFINGFRDDGYCDEGAGYWAYGFGNYVILREVLADATRGRIELFSNPKIRSIAAYGERIQLLDQIAPPFADCHFGTTADVGLTGYCNRVLKTGVGGDRPRPSACREKLALQFMTVTPCAAALASGASSAESTGVRSFFEQAGVLVCRPQPGTACRLSAAIKAGGNSSHSHNDIGSFVIAAGGEILAGDPGGPHAYNNKTFGAERYTYKILNSFGHPVPVVAGRLQRNAAQVHPQVLKTDFTAARDEIQINLQPAYAVPELLTLVRTLRYSRSGRGGVELEDRVAFTKTMSFELGLPTLGRVKQLDARTLQFSLNGESLTAEVETPDGFELASEQIEELGTPAFTRLGLKLRKPVMAATVKVTFRPPPE